MDALDAALARARRRRGGSATVVTRTLVDPARPRVPPRRPSRSAGSCRTDEAQLLIEHGETWEDRGAKGWRRVVASARSRSRSSTRRRCPRSSTAGFVVVANGGGGVPTIRTATPTASLAGVEAVIDKDLGAAAARRGARGRPARSSPPTSTTPSSAGAPRTPGRLEQVGVAELTGLRGPWRVRCRRAWGRRSRRCAGSPRAPAGRSAITSLAPDQRGGRGYSGHPRSRLTHACPVGDHTPPQSWSCPTTSRRARSNSPTSATLRGWQIRRGRRARGRPRDGRHRQVETPEACGIVGPN